MSTKETLIKTIKDWVKLDINIHGIYFQKIFKTIDTIMLDKN